MSDVEDLWTKSSVLVEVVLPDPPDFSEELVDLVASLRVVLLGSYLLPEQTTPEQASEQMADECSDVLARFVDVFEEAGADVDARVVFTQDALETATRVSEDEDCDAVLLVRPLQRLDRVLACIRGSHALRAICSFIGGLLAESVSRVTVFHAREEDEEEGDVEEVLDEARELLMEHGVEEDWIDIRVEPPGDAVEQMLEAAEDHDVVVLGESEPNMPDLLFGTISERVARDVSVPVFVVRRRH